MALTGLDIFKLLPKTNCGECGVPTCMAFAMKLAAKNAELCRLPLRVRGGEDEDRRGQQAAHPAGEDRPGGARSRGRQRDGDVPPREDLRASHGDRGGVLRRAAGRRAGTPDRRVREYCLERVGEQLMLDLVLVENTSGEVEPFVAAVKAVAGGAGRGVILQEHEPGRAGGGAAGARGPAPADPCRHRRERGGDGRAGAEV